MEFKRISDAELVQVSEETNLLVEVNGEVKRTSSTEYMNEIDGGSTAANLEALKNLAVTLGCAESVEDVASETVAEAIEFISDNYTGGVSSWNDLTDKPFGVEGTTENEILSTFETNYSFDNGIYLHGAPLNIALENGKSYIVKYDSMEYAVTANTKVFEVNGGLSAVCIGDLKLTGESDDNNYPFCFVCVPQYGVCFLCGADENVHTVSVSEVVEQVKQLDPKFVPGAGMVVKMTEDTSDASNIHYVTDKTFNEIAEAIESGCIVTLACVMPSGLTSYFNLMMYAPSESILFDRMGIMGEPTDAMGSYFTCTISPDNTVQVSDLMFTVTIPR